MSHFPLVSEESFGHAHNAKYPGHMEDGQLLLDRLKGHGERRILTLPGHMHWNCVTHDPLWVQCTTGGMIEFPIRLRMVTLEADSMKYEVLGVASPEILAQSLDSAEWVRGTPQDRQDTISLRAPL